MIQIHEQEHRSPEPDLLPDREEDIRFEAPDQETRMDHHRRWDLFGVAIERALQRTGAARIWTQVGQSAELRRALFGRGKLADSSRAHALAPQLLVVLTRLALRTVTRADWQPSSVKEVFTHGRGQIDLGWLLAQAQGAWTAEVARRRRTSQKLAHLAYGKVLASRGSVRLVSIDGLVDFHQMGPGVSDPAFVYVLLWEALIQYPRRGLAWLDPTGTQHEQHAALVNWRRAMERSRDLLWSLWGPIDFDPDDLSSFEGRRAYFEAMLLFARLQRAAAANPRERAADRERLTRDNLDGHRRNYRRLSELLASVPWTIGFLACVNHLDVRKVEDEEDQAHLFQKVGHTLVELMEQASSGWPAWASVMLERWGSGYAIAHPGFPNKDAEGNDVARSIERFQGYFQTLAGTPGPAARLAQRPLGSQLYPEYPGILTAEQWARAKLVGKEYASWLRRVPADWPLLAERLPDLVEDADPILTFKREHQHKMWRKLHELTRGGKLVLAISADPHPEAERAWLRQELIRAFEAAEIERRFGITLNRELVIAAARDEWGFSAPFLHSPLPTEEDKRRDRRLYDALVADRNNRRTAARKALRCLLDVAVGPVEDYLDQVDHLEAARFGGERLPYQIDEASDEDAFNTVVELARIGFTIVGIVRWILDKSPYAAQIRNDLPRVCARMASPACHWAHSLEDPAVVGAAPKTGEELATLLSSRLRSLCEIIERASATIHQTGRRRFDDWQSEELVRLFELPQFQGLVTFTMLGRSRAWSARQVDELVAVVLAMATLFLVIPRGTHQVRLLQDFVKEGNHEHQDDDPTQRD